MTHLVGSIWSKKLLRKQCFYLNVLFLVIIFFIIFVSLANITLAQSPQERAEANQNSLNGAINAGGGVLPGIINSTRPVPGGVAGGGMGLGGPMSPEELAAAEALAPPPEVPVIPKLGGTHDPILIVLHGIVTAVGWVAGQFGYMFDYAISNYIVGFGDKYINYNIGNVIDNLWSTVRDIFNLTFIFGLVYIGFKMILDSGDSSARKMLVSLIGAALLVNFSLFITKFVVDFSNIAAYQIYKAFAGSAANGDFSLTRAFMNQMGIDSLFSVPYVEGYQYILGLLIVFLVLAYVFLAGAIMIIIRFVVLNIYMVFSPLMFLGWVFPAMKGYSTKYWSGFLSQAFFAPAFLFMLYLSYRVADSYKYTGKDFNLIFNPQSSTFGGNATSVNEIIPYFAMVIVFLVASIVVAKKIGGTSASLGIAMTNKIRGGAQGVLAGGAGKFSKNKLDSWATREDAPIRRGLARGATLLGVRDYADKQYKSSPQGKWAETRKKRAGELSTRTADAKVEAEIKRNAKTGGPALETAIRGATTGQIIGVLRDYKVNTPEYNNIVDSLTHEQRKKVLDSKDEDFNASEKSNLGGRTNQKIRSQIAGTGGAPDPSKVAKLTPKEIDVLGNAWIMDNLHSLSNSQVEKLASDSSVLAETQKSTLKEVWGKDLTSKLSAGGINFADYMANRSAKDVAALPAAFLTDVGAVPHLTDKVLREIAVTNMITPDRDKIDANVMGLSGPGSSYFSSTNTHYKTHW